MRKLFFVLFFLLIPFSTSAQIADHLVISEVVYGNMNAKDEFIEIYNPTDQAINLQDLDFKLHIRNSTGSSDSNKTINWIHSSIPAQGFFLFVSKDSSSYLEQADATYSAALVSNGAVYISTVKAKMEEIIDFISWGDHNSPSGYEQQNISNLSVGESIERKSNSLEVGVSMGNAWDTDSDDFILQTIPMPQNSRSPTEAHTLITEDTIAPAAITNLSVQNISSSSVEFSWSNPIDTDILGVFLKKDQDSAINIGAVSSYIISGLNAATDYSFFFEVQDSSGNWSPSVQQQITTLQTEDIIAPSSISNLSLTDTQATSLSFTWINPGDSDLADIFVKVNGGTSQSLGIVNSHTFDNLLSETSYSFNFYAQDSAGNVSLVTNATYSTSIIPDTEAPAEVSNITANVGIAEVKITWTNPLDEDFEAVFFRYAKDGEDYGEVENLETNNTTYIEDLLPNTSYNFQFQTIDTNGNISTGIVINQTMENCDPISNTVHINEIAWPGMAAIAEENQSLSYGHSYQWIELFNTGAEKVDLTGWKILSDQGLEILLDDLTIFAADFLILQNNELEIFSSEEIIPDLYYSDSGIRIDSDTTNLQLIDQCGNSLELIPEIFAGDYSSYRSMARLSPDNDSSQTTSWFNEKLNGSPKATNIYSDIDLSIAYLTPDPYYPRPDQSFILNVDVSNLASEAARAESWSIVIEDNLETVIAQASGVLLENYANFSIIPITMPALSEGAYAFTAKIICGSDDCGEYAFLEQSIEVKKAPWISEVFPKTRDGEYEWIEFFNPLDEDFLADGTQLCIDDNCLSLQFNIPTQSTVVISENDTETFLEEWITLVNTSKTLIWKQEEWVYNDDYIEGFDDPNDEWILSETILDQFSYESALVGTSFSRNTNTGVITQSSHITEGKENDYNQAPIPVITIQESGKTSGNPPFYINVTGESSQDLDGDILSYNWDFGDGQTSTDSNPAGIYYSATGTYALTLVVNDSLGESASTSIQIEVLPGGGRKSSTIHTPINLQKKEPDVNITHPYVFLSKVSVNDEQEDWVELHCMNCELPIFLGGYSLYDDKVFYQFPPEFFLVENESIVISLAQKKRDSKKKNHIILEKKQGLTKTDEQILLFDDKDILVDAVCWNNFDTKFSKSELKEEALLKEKNIWKGDCIHSKILEKKNQVLVRDIKKTTDRSKESWFVYKDIKPFESIQKPITKDDIEIFISQIDFKNPEADSITFFCKQCDADLSQINLFVGTSEVFRFPKNSFIHSGEFFHIIFAEENENLKKEEKTFFSKEKSLTGTDDALSLKDSNNDVEDFVCWSNREGTEKRRTDLSGIMYSLVSKRKEQGVWEKSCLNSSKVEKIELFVRNSFNDHLNKIAYFQIQERGKISEEIEIVESGLFISELLINPFGDDTKFEWIEIQNTLNQSINIHSWRLESGVKSYEFGSLELAAREFLILPTTQTKLSLKNQEGEVSLYNPQGKKVQKINYKKSLEGMSFSLNKEKEFEWTSVKTPGLTNIFAPVFGNKEDDDKDGLSNEFEKEIGTNPQKRDTDNDKFPDAFELEYGMNPLVFDEKAETIFKEFLLETLQQKIRLPEKEGDLLKISGNTIPFAKMKLYVHSNLHIFVVQANKQGKWEYVVPKLEAGKHKLQTQLIDPDGSVSVLSDPVFFSLKEDYKQVKNSGIKKKDSEEKELLAYMDSRNYKTFSKKASDSEEFYELGKADYKGEKEEMNVWWYLLWGMGFFFGGIGCFVFKISMSFRTKHSGDPESV